MSKKEGVNLNSINLSEFETAASKVLPPKSFAFFKAGADDESTTEWNQLSWQSVPLRPRVLRPIEHISLSTTILGTSFSAPFFIAPAGAGKLAHPTGEVLMTAAAAQQGVLQWVSNMAGCSMQEMANAKGQEQTLFWQIYAMTDLSVTEREVRRAVELGYKGFALTVDAVRMGKRERDLKLNIEEDEGFSENDDEKTGGGISSIRPPVYDRFDWVSAVEWFRTITTLPIAIKGIQTWEDAKLCMEHGVHPYLSNHGGRQLNGAPSALETLLEIREHCPEVLEKCDVIVDGGFRRGTDVVKALCFGAKAVGLGRPFLYSLVWGKVGVNRAIRILRQEVETAMALLGVEKVEDLGMDYVEVVDGLSRCMVGDLKAHL